MDNGNPGITFKETMRGGFALGAEDPEVGRRTGREVGIELAMHAMVEIDDIAEFAADPEHPGRLSGSVDFPPLGNDMAADRGVFKLFSPGDRPELKWMVYELAFEHEGESYYLAGKKEVRDDPGFDLWTDTTTLYTRLYEGTNTSGPIVGAGILRLGIKDLIKLISTMRATNADSTQEKVRAFSTFGQMFLGELWDSYAKHAPQP